MRGNRAATLLFLLGICLGGVASHMRPVDALASRNSGGTYSLPAGQPVVSGTTITASVHNALATDVATELTSSLDRSGRGAMLAPLQLTNGTVSLPSLTFATDVNTGLYRIGADNPALSCGGSNCQAWTTTGTTITGTVATSNTITGTVSTTNGNAIYVTANGTGEGVVATGGSTSGRGGSFFGGAPNGNGAAGTAQGSGYGLLGVTAGTGNGVRGTAVTGSAVYGDASSTGTGGYFSSGAGNALWGECIGCTANSGGGADTRYAVVSETGHVKLLSGNPTSTTTFKNVVTPMNTLKGWAYITMTAGTPVVTAGFNVTSVSRDSSRILVNWGQDFSSASYGVVATLGGLDSNSGATIVGFPIDAGQAGLDFYAGNTVATPLVIGLLSGTFTIMAMGAQ